MTNDGTAQSRKGIVLAGGYGTRFRPVTPAINKHLLPVYDKPVIFHSISNLMLMGIRDILIITTPDAIEAFRVLLGTGERFGLKVSYASQAEPTGVPEALVIGEEFLAGSKCVLALGDNLIHGQGLTALLNRGLTQTDGATLFAYEVTSPNAFGVVEFEGTGKIISLQEKPVYPRSNWVAIGLYLFDECGPTYARSLKPSARGETEIIDLLQVYLDAEALEGIRISRGVAWLDVGTPENLLSASEFFRMLDQRQRLKSGVLEEIAWRRGWISKNQLQDAALYFKNTPYGEYLQRLADGR